MFGHQKHVPYFPLNFYFSLPEYFVYLLCLPVFLVSVIGSIINTTAIKTVVGKFELRMSRPLPHVNHLCRLGLVTAHMRRLVRIYLVRIFPRKGLSTWCKTNHFFYFKKDIPDKRNAHNRTDNTPCQKLATKIKAFQSAFEVPLTARADRLPY